MKCTNNHVAKTKALISFCIFVFAYADCWFSHEAAHIISLCGLVGWLYFKHGVDVITSSFLVKRGSPWPNPIIAVTLLRIDSSIYGVSRFERYPTSRVRRTYVSIRSSYSSTRSSYSSYAEVLRFVMCALKNS